MNKLSEVIKKSGLSIQEARRTTTPPTRYLFGEEDYKNMWHLTIEKGDKDMTVYMVCHSEVTIEDVIENILGCIRVDLNYSCTAWLHELGVTPEEWEVRWEQEKRGRRITQDHKEGLMRLLGRGGY